MLCLTVARTSSFRHLTAVPLCALSLEVNQTPKRNEKKSQFHIQSTQIPTQFRHRRHINHHRTSVNRRIRHYHLGTSSMSDSSSHSPLKALTLTHVRYTKGDKLGYFLAWISLVPVFISLGGFVSHFIFRRELQGICFALGLLISQFINELIKTSVQQARPETCVLLEACDSHGWPSSHSQYMFFFATYFTLLQFRKRKNWGFFDYVVQFIVWALAFFTMVSRVYLGYHSVSQVFAGAVLGTVLGAAWYWGVQNMLIHYFPLIEDSPIGRRFYIKDTSHIPNVFKFEYDNARAARQKAINKSN